MRKMRLTTMLFGLLLAVGWTNSAQAQLALDRSMVPASKWNVFAHGREQATQVPQFLNKGQGVTRQAPRKATNDVYANTVLTKSEYSNIKYTWYEGPTTSYTSHTASLTDAVTDANQMYWLFRSTYTNTNIPGIRWNDVIPAATVYYGLGHGWNVGSATKVDANIYIENSYGRLFGIWVDDFEGNELYSWTASSTSLPTGWSYSGTRTRTTYTYNGTNYYCWYFSSGGSITIPASQLPTAGCKITIIAASSSSSNTCSFYIFNNYAGTEDNMIVEGGTFPAYPYEYSVDMWNDYGTITAPSANGYTIFLLKLKDDFKDVELDENNPDPYWAEWNKRASQYTAQELINTFDEYYNSVELLTDGLRVGENPGDTTSGTVFAYQGVLNRFYLIGKGKTATRSNKYDFGAFGTSGPFYAMYEEFSPTSQNAGDQTTDLYQRMWNDGEYYPVKHDCQTVLGMSHYFSMYGKDTTVYKSVSPIVFYIPDLRSQVDTRDYEVGHQPQVGLYRAFLTAETEPATTYAQDSMYTVTLDWSSTLNDMVNNTVDQTYIIYTVEFDSLGNRVYHPLDTLVNPTDLTYSYNVKQTLGSQQITYVIMAFPTDATNNPVNQQGGIFYTYSNVDDVQIPGLFDFMVLYRERYESDFIINEEQNYYRNYLYPTNLSHGTGMTMEQLKKEWPNQTASYTLWRDNTGVAVLEVKAIGKKVYYRIRYYDETQNTTGVNNIEIPNGYQTISNN